MGSSEPLPQITARHNDFLAVLIAAYLIHAKKYYAGKGDWKNVRETAKLLLRFIGKRSILGHQFGPKMFLEFQTWLIDREPERGTQKMSRGVVNSHCGRVRRMFRWLQSQELLPKGHAAELSTVLPLMPGRTAARESDPVSPPTWGDVEKTLPYLPPSIANAVRVQFICGMRPGEVLSMQVGDIDCSRDVWLWSPDHHKTSHRKKILIKAIPRAAQAAILAMSAGKSIGDFLVSPLDDLDWRATSRPIRKTKIFPCELARRKEKSKASKRKKLNYYTETRYGKEIAAAIDRAASVGDSIPRWTPNQLRHAIASEISGKIDEQSAQRWLGHSRLETTAIYTQQVTNELLAIAEEVDKLLSR